MAQWPSDRWWQRSGWKEAAVLLAGVYSDDCTPVIRWLKDAQPEVAAQCILESGAEIADRDGLFAELHEAGLPRLTDLKRDPQPEARAAVGRALGRLGLDDLVGRSPTTLSGANFRRWHLPPRRLARGCTGSVGYRSRVVPQQMAQPRSH